MFSENEHEKDDALYAKWKLWLISHYQFKYESTTAIRRIVEHSTSEKEDTGDPLLLFTFREFRGKSRSFFSRKAEAFVFMTEDILRKHIEPTQRWSSVNFFSSGKTVHSIQI